MQPTIEEPIFEIETLHDWQLNAGAEEAEEGGAGCNTGNSTNNDAD